MAIMQEEGSHGPDAGQTEPAGIFWTAPDEVIGLQEAQALGEAGPIAGQSFRWSSPQAGTSSYYGTEPCRTKPHKLHHRRAPDRA